MYQPTRGSLCFIRDALHLALDSVVDMEDAADLHEVFHAAVDELDTLQAWLIGLGYEDLRDD